jgi:hypothetical protein
MLYRTLFLPRSGLAILKHRRYYPSLCAERKLAAVRKHQAIRKGGY